jgi:methyl-accepting chemotaxis protein
MSFIKLPSLTDNDILKALDLSQAIVHFSPDGTILSANDNFLKLMGYRLGEITGKHHGMFVTQAERSAPDYRAFWQDLAAGKFRKAVFKRISRDGREIFIQASYNPILDSKGRVRRVVKFATDVTAEVLKAAEEEAQVTAILKTQAVIHFTPEGTVLWANDLFLNVMGYRLEEIQGKPHALFVDETYAKSQDYRSFWADLRSARARTAEFRRIAKGGREVWIQATYTPILDPAGKLVKVVKYATDITAQKLISADHQGQISAIGRTHGVIEFDLDGKILLANDNFLAATGYRLDEISGRHHSMFMPGDEARSDAYQAFWQKLRAGDFVAGIHKRVGKGGRPVWLRATYNPIFDASGRVCKVVKYATDITRLITSHLAAVSSAQVTLGNVEAVAAASEELTASVSEITRAADSGHRSAEVMRDNVTRGEAAVARLKETTSAMNGVIKLIQEIASQINLLSLNATIEASRAGEAGRGFTVVASEIKTLSGQTATATENIARQIAELQDVSRTVDATMTGITGGISALHEASAVLSSAIEEQLAMTRSIAGNMHQAVDGVTGTTDSLAKMMQ